MKRSHTTGVALGLSVLCLAAYAPEAQAVKITNVTQGITLFDSGGFENDTVGQDAATASPGVWSNTGLPVDKVATGGVPGAFEGNNYLSTERGFISAGNARAFFAPQSTPGDLIHAEWMMWIPTTADIGFFLDDNSLGGNPMLQTRMGSGGPIVQHLNISTFDPLTPPLGYTPEVWQKWELDYTLGDSVFTVTIDGVSGEGNIANPALSAVDHLSFFHNGLQTYFIDSVPASALVGDLNGDGFVGIADLNIVLGAWNQNVPPGNPLADPSGDGFVGIEDLNTVLGNWNAGTPPASAVVPEPTGLAMLALGGLTLLRNGRKQGR
jgi:hypothetical protein